MKKIVMVVSIFLSLLSGVALESVSETFVIAYRKLVPRATRNVVFTYLMKVNAAGEVVMKPQRIASEFDRSFGDIGLSWGWPGINLWITGINSNPSGPRYVTTRLSMRSTNFVTTDVKRVKVEEGGPSFVSITNKVDENFILFADKQQVAVIAARLFKTGKTTGEVWQLSRQKENADGPAIVSGDGRMAAWFSNERLVIQRLHPNGRPSKIRTVLPQFKFATSLAITNVLPGSRRYLLLTNVRGNGSCSGFRNHYSLIVIDDTTAKQIYTAFQYEDGTNCFTATVQIDPKGRFFTLTDFEFKRGSVHLYYPLLFQSLDSDGRRAGVARPLADNVELGFSMLSN